LCYRVWGSRIVLLFLCIFVTAFVRTQATNQKIIPIFLIKDKEVQVKGIVVENPTWYDKSVYFYLQSGKNKIWVKCAFIPNELAPMEKVLQKENLIQCKGITGITESPFHTLSAHQEYLKRKNAAGYLIVQPDDIKVLQQNKSGFFVSKIDHFRIFFQNNLGKVFKDITIRDFMIAITLGPTSGKSYVKEQYSQIGILHMMAISGANLMILAVFFLFILTLLSIKTPYKEATVILLLLIYLALIGFLPGAVRSFIMITFVLLAGVLRKIYNPLTAISLAGILLLAWNPWLLFNSGFQLSFLGVMAFLLPISLISKGFVATFVTSLLVSFQFHILSLSSLLANFLLLPFLPIFYLTGILCGVGFPFFSWMIFLLTQTWNLFEWLTNQLSLLPFSYRFIPAFPFLFLILYYAVIFTLLFLQFYEDNPIWINRTKKVLLVFIMLPMFIFVYPKALDKRARINFIDVGQGDSCLIQLPEGFTILMDGGKADSGVLTLLKREGINKIDLIILSHYHDDHYGGILDVIQNVPTVSRLILPDTESSDQKLFADLYQKVTRKLPRVDRVCGRKRIILSSSCRIDFFTPVCDSSNLDPENENNRSLVCRFQYGDISILFPGDIEEPVETALVKESGTLLVSTLLKLPHHGSNTSSSKNFLLAVNPRKVVISSGLKKLFNHPSDSVLERLIEMEYSYSVTRETGDIQFYSNGRNLTQFYEENP
jgi:competence protein ComEC